MFLIAYIGGPLTVPLRALAGDQIGAMTRAKVLWNLGIALGAAFGVERLATSRSSGSSWSLSRSVGVASLVGLALAIAMIPSGIVWFEAVTAEDVLREVLAVSVVPALSAVCCGSDCPWPEFVAGLLSRPQAGALAGVVGFEMLSFMMPVHTFAEPDERLTATPAHAVVH